MFIPNIPIRDQLKWFGNEYVYYITKVVSMVISPLLRDLENKSCQKTLNIISD